MGNHKSFQYTQKPAVSSEAVLTSTLEEVLLSRIFWRRIRL